MREGWEALGVLWCMIMIKGGKLMGWEHGRYEHWVIGRDRDWDWDDMTGRRRVLGVLMCFFASLVRVFRVPTAWYDTMRYDTIRE